MGPHNFKIPIVIRDHDRKYITRYIGRKEMLNTKYTEFNNAAIFPVRHELPRLRRGQINVAGIRRRQET